MAENNEQLVRWLDRHAFEPVLRKSADDYSGTDRDKYEHVRRATDSEKSRFEGYVLQIYRDRADDAWSSAEAVVERSPASLLRIRGPKRVPALAHAPAAV